MPPFLALRRGQLLGLLMLVTLVQLATSVVVARVVVGLFLRLQTGAGANGQLMWLLAGAILATLVAELARRLLTEALGLDYAADLRMALFERLLRRPLSSGPQRSRGSQLLPFVGDLTALRLWWADGVARGSSSALIAAGLVGGMAWMAPAVAVRIGALALLALALMAAIAGPYFQATSRQRSVRGTLTAVLSDRIEGSHAIMATGSVQRELNRIRARVNRMNRAALWRAGWSGLMRGLLAAFPLAGIMVMAGSRLPSHDVAGLLALSGMLGAALVDLGRAVELAIPARIAQRRLRQRFDEVAPLLTRAGGGPVRRAPLLEFDCLRLSSRGQPCSAAFRKGEIVVLEGSQAGHLAGLLAGLGQPLAGAVRIAGHDAHALSQRQRRQWLGVAAPWVPLLQDALADNLLQRMRGGAGATEMPALLADLGLPHLLDEHDRIRPLRLRDDGAPMDPRERAAVRVARALVGQPRLLVLHACAANLDDAQIDALGARLQHWPGVVVLVEAAPRLTRLATRRFAVGSSVAEIPLVQGEPDHAAAIHALRPASAG